MSSDSDLPRIYFVSCGATTLSAQTVSRILALRDFNVFTEAKRIEKLRYMHRNPVVHGPVAKPEDWTWSNFCHHATGLGGTVEIESCWTGWRRDHAGIPFPPWTTWNGAP